MGNNSTYLIDMHKKCVIDTNLLTPKRNDIPSSLWGVPYSAYGNVKSETLSKIGMGFVEGFASAADQAKEEFEKIAKPATLLLNAIIGTIPLIKNSGVKADSGGFRDAMIRIYALLGGYMEIAGLEPDGDTAKTIMNMFEKVYTYDPPMRKSPPKLSVQGSSSITIEFQYGSCNVYDAYWEVYYPLMQLQNNLFPRPKYNSEGDDGTATYDGASNAAPYQQQIFVELIKTIFKTVTRTQDFSYKEDIRSLSGFTKDFAKNMSSNEDKLAKMLDRVTEKEMTSGALAIWNWDEARAKAWNEKALKINTNVRKVIEGGNLRDKVTIDNQKDLLKTDRDKVNSAEKDTVKDVTKGAVLNLWDKAKTVANDNPDNLDIQGTIPSRVHKDDSSMVFNIKTEDSAEGGSAAVEEGANSAAKILSKLANWEPHIIGTALKNIYETYASKHAHNIYLAYPNQYVTSLADFFKSGIADKSSIALRELLFQSMAIHMDYNNVDERGFPLYGTLEIKQMWPLSWPVETLQFRNDANKKAYEGAYSKGNIRY